MRTKPKDLISIERRMEEQRLPKGPVVMYQSWKHLLFLHWPFAPDLIQKTLPPGLEVDTYAGQAWIGVVPFLMRRVRPRFFPPLPGLSNFNELNLRTYVHDAQGRPGVWFYSLDTDHRIATAIARNFFHLNYQLATMTSEQKVDGSIVFKSERAGKTQNFSWQPVPSPPFTATPGSLEFFLVERYRLFAYAKSKKTLYTGQVHHAPYPLESAKVKQYSSALFSLNGLGAPREAPTSILASAGVNVRIFPLKKSN